MTSNYLKRSRMISNSDSDVNRTLNKKNKLEGGRMHVIGEINAENLDEFIQNNNF